MLRVLVLLFLASTLARCSDDEKHQVKQVSLNIKVDYDNDKPKFYEYKYIVSKNETLENAALNFTTNSATNHSEVIFVLIDQNNNTRINKKKKGGNRKKRLHRYNRKKNIGNGTSNAKRKPLKNKSNSLRNKTVARKLNKKDRLKHNLNQTTMKNKNGNTNKGNMTKSSKLPMRDSKHESGHNPNYDPFAKFKHWPIAEGGLHLSLIADDHKREEINSDWQSSLASKTLRGLIYGAIAGGSVILVTTMMEGTTDAVVLGGLATIAEDLETISTLSDEIPELEEIDTPPRTIENVDGFYNRLLVHEWNAPNVELETYEIPNLAETVRDSNVLIDITNTASISQTVAEGAVVQTQGGTVVVESTSLYDLGETDVLSTIKGDISSILRILPRNP